MSGYEGEALSPNITRFPIPLLRELHEEKQLPKTTGWQHNTEWHIGEEPVDFLRIKLPKGLAGEMKTEDGWRAGATFLVHQGVAPADHYYLRYDHRFPTGFNWVQGGKLPGLYGGTAPMGGEIAEGTNGFTSRLMWRQKGNGEVYLYAPYEENAELSKSQSEEISKRWGINIGRGNWQFVADNNWHKIEQELKLNTPGQKDGQIGVWYDGKEVMKQNGIYIRATDDLKINGLVICSFFGGNDPTWASPVDTHVDLANFELSDAR